jgi:hypothetical protein
MMNDRTGGPVLIGYAAVSTQGQDLDQQRAALSANGGDKVRIRTLRKSRNCGRGSQYYDPRQNNPNNYQRSQRWW